MFTIDKKYKEYEVTAGKFKNVIRIKIEISTVENGKYIVADWASSYEYYAYGVGLIKCEQFIKMPNGKPVINKELVEYEVH